jgi:hypothetical protein
MKDRFRTYGSLVGAAILVLAGTVATGVLPSTLPFQLVAGLLIVAGFVLAYAGAIGIELPE